MADSTVGGTTFTASGDVPSAIPNRQNFQQLLAFIRLEIDVALRPFEEKPLERRVLLCWTGSAGRFHALKVIDGC
jgi:hypothetical protein